MSGIRPLQTETIAPLSEQGAVNAPNGKNATGEITKISEIDVYLAKPTGYPNNICKFLLLLTGGTGIHSKNNQLQADKYAEQGFLVVMPDQFNGDSTLNSFNTDTISTTKPVAATETSNANLTVISSSENAQNAQQESTGIDKWLENALQLVKSTIYNITKAGVIDLFLARQTPAKILPILHKVVQGCKDEFGDAIAYGGGIYCVGYCVGAKYALLLAAGGNNKEKDSTKPIDETQSEDSKEGDNVVPQKSQEKHLPLVKVVAIAHGTQITPDDFRGLRVPVALVCVENDSLFPDNVRDEALALLQKNCVQLICETLSDVPHGFAVEGNYDDDKIKAEQKKAFELMLGWLKTH